MFTHRYKKIVCSVLSRIRLLILLWFASSRHDIGRFAIVSLLNTVHFRNIVAFFVHLSMNLELLHRIMQTNLKEFPVFVNLPHSDFS